MNKLSIIRILLLATLFLSIGCGSKKKALQKSKEVIDVEAFEVVKEKEEISVGVSLDTSTEIIKKDEEENTSVNIVADSSGVVTKTTKVNEDGSITETFSGIKSITFDNNKKKSESTEVTETKKDSTSVSSKEKDSSSRIKLGIKKEDKAIDLEVESSSWWFWSYFFWVILIIALVYITYRKRKTILNWVKKFIPWI